MPRNPIPLCAVVLALAAPGAALAEGASLNLLGMPGLIEMPSGQMQPDGMLSFSGSRFGNVSRTGFTFQATPRLSGAFRFSTLRDWNAQVCPPDCAGVNAYDTFFGHGFDLRYQLLEESGWRPALSIGLQGIAGTGNEAAEYLVASKSLGPRLTATAGLGWGRLASRGSLGAPFGARPAADPDVTGTVDVGSWFRGDVAPFGGLEYRLGDHWTIKAEYSSDAWTDEDGSRGLIDIRSPLNFGVEYQKGRNLRFGAYSLYGSEVGVSLQVLLDARARPAEFIYTSGPTPVKPRLPYAADPEAWSPEWVEQDEAKPILTENLVKLLERSGIVVEALGYTADTVQIRFRNPDLDAEAQAVGRVARALTHAMPASVEVFEIIPVVRGMPAAKVVLRRSDVEALEFAPDGAAALRARAVIADPGAPIAGLRINPDLYPDFTWSILPYLRTNWTDPAGTFRADVGLRAAASYEIAPGLVLSGAVTKRVVGNLSSAVPGAPSALPPVRSDLYAYDSQGDPALESLTAAWYSHPAPNLYGRVTLGMLERMFGGISTEILWKRADLPFALGAEVNYVAQRDPDQGLGFDTYDYTVATGHLSAYYELGGGYMAQLDLGRYLAGDLGGTLTLNREFANGWKVSAFATLTEASFAEFGAGSFDKGIKVEIPFSWFTGQPSRTTRLLDLRPLSRDGGARLEVDGRLYDLIRDYQAPGMDDQWGRVWK